MPATARSHARAAAVCGSIISLRYCNLSRVRFAMREPHDREEGAMSQCDPKDTVEIIKGVVEIAGFLVAILYFGYRLLAGMFVLGRLETELVSDTPFADKCLVRSTLKLKNVGEATLKVTDARLSTFEVDARGRTKRWPEQKTEAQPFIDQRDLADLDFQRLSVPPKQGGRWRITKRRTKKSHG